MITQQKLTDAQKHFIFDMSPKLSLKRILLDLFTATELNILDVAITEKEYDDIRRGKLFTVEPQDELEVFVIKSKWKNKPDLITYTINTNSIKYVKDYIDTTLPIFPVTAQMDIKPNEIINFKNTKPELVSLGRYLVNHVVLVESFEDLIEFTNVPYNIDNAESLIVKALIAEKITPQQCRRYLDAGYALFQFTELSVPSFSERSVTTGPDINKLKKELFEKYKGQLTDPIVSYKIKEALVNYDKEWLGDDSSTSLYNGVGKKAYDVQRNKMYLAVGGIEAFGKDISSYEFIEGSLIDGWDKKEMPIIFNDIRKGSFDRSTSTAMGGALTNFVLRVFQDTEIVEKDCKAKKGLKFVLTKELSSKFIGRYIIHPTEDICITEDNVSKYIDKQILIRSPMYCKSKTGYCEKCAGKLFTSLDLKAISMEIVDITSTFVTQALKSMHGTAISIDTIKFEDYFVT